MIYIALGTTSVLPLKRSAVEKPWTLLIHSSVRNKNISHQINHSGEQGKALVVKPSGYLQLWIKPKSNEEFCVFFFLQNCNFFL